MGNSLGVQFHPEATPAVVRRWVDFGGAQQCARLGIDPDELVARSRAMEPVARENAYRLVDALFAGWPSQPAETSAMAMALSRNTAAACSPCGASGDLIRPLRDRPVQVGRESLTLGFAGWSWGSWGHPFRQPG
ncbi:hypothetical protein ABTX60_24975 [Streptomyces sp. NPDC126510]|uniref:hypothetical protein n=1 Tax=Streptomyces sp. NPDC126510 TaxID=3155317 RepID=UPI0033286040